MIVGTIIYFWNEQLTYYTLAKDVPCSVILRSHTAMSAVAHATPTTVFAYLKASMHSLQRYAM